MTDQELREKIKGLHGLIWACAVDALSDDFKKKDGSLNESSYIKYKQNSQDVTVNNFMALFNEVRVDTANHLHRQQGDGLPRRTFDNDTDEYICTVYIPRLEQLRSQSEEG